MRIEGKNIILGVTGGIAAYKALELVRLLKKEGAEVYPVMTRAATKFITPLSMTTLAAREARVDLFAGGGAGERGDVDHISLADKADLIVVAPATANIIGKVAGGIADDLLSTVIMATPAPVLLAPAMNTRMYENPIVTGNIGKLRALGYLFVEPGVGELACGWEGKGRLAEPADILEAVKEGLSEKDLKGEKVLVTAAATREPVDPVRFLSNASSGIMGYAVARAAKRRGAEVVLISGPSAEHVPSGITFVRVETAKEMRDAVLCHFPQSTVVVMAAAVSDFSPVKRFSEKVKKDKATLTLELESSPDILKELGETRISQVLVGFALETENLIENATKKLKNKKLDMVVANTPAALSKETNKVTFVKKDGKTEALEVMSKDEVAERILGSVLELKGP